MFMHVIDLPLKTPPKEIQDPITSALGSFVSALALPRLPELVRSTLEAGHALLILDGLDELPGEGVPQNQLLVGAAPAKVSQDPGDCGCLSRELCWLEPAWIQTPGSGELERAAGDGIH